jgi:hydrogenase expression/formation protein HypC
MCLGIPARVVSVGADPPHEQHPDIATADFAGVLRLVNVGLLETPVSPGDWILVHMGFALSTMTEREAAEALDVFADERRAEQTQ